MSFVYFIITISVSKSLCFQGVIHKPVYTLSIENGPSDRFSAPKHHILHEQCEVSEFVFVITMYLKYC